MPGTQAKDPTSDPSWISWPTTRTSGLGDPYLVYEFYRGKEPRMLMWNSIAEMKNEQLGRCRVKDYMRQLQDPPPPVPGTKMRDLPTLKIGWHMGINWSIKRKKASIKKWVQSMTIS